MSSTDTNLSESEIERLLSGMGGSNGSAKDEILSMEELEKLFGCDKPYKDNRPMSHEILTIDEVEKILSMMGVDPPEPIKGPDPNFVIINGPPIESILSLKQARAWQTRYEEMARRLGSELTRTLSRCIEVKLCSIDQMYYTEFLFGVSNPSHYSLIQLDTSDTAAYLTLDTDISVLFPLLEHMLGGGYWEDTRNPRRPLTRLECKLVGKVINTILHEFQLTLGDWATVSCVEAFSNPRFVRKFSDNDRVVVVAFEVCLSCSRGIVSLCFPKETVELIESKVNFNKE